MTNLYVVECNVRGQGAWRVCQTYDSDGLECAAAYLSNDEADEAYALWVENGGVYRVREVSVSGSVTPSVTDIQGNTVFVGDHVAYASQNYMIVLEVLDISVDTGVVTARSVKTGRTHFYGVFNDRALKLKDYTK